MIRILFLVFRAKKSSSSLRLNLFLKPKLRSFARDSVLKIYETLSEEK